ncbi:transcription-repair coupling factor [Desulfonispora thiosulfatigenes DSM 11270]|uniref:Transcription-repair-coupling factor n=1 Tax=Desulfonispora thiosulfatigenes DSM 11270 TaxID=656914 RepID=A0A1W1UZF7_DESTI|nr:transcription-repair coupling factor [Desulfonispora thiosulfatigenes]SMB86487.1 transcription-repair coupling factor [Desulfonispora thiosulfatigenes DSM 11270]
MQTPPILGELANSPDIELVLKSFTKNKEQYIYGLSGVQKNILLSLVGLKTDKSMLVVCDNLKRAKEICDDLNFLLPDYDVLYFPPLEVIPFEILAQSVEIQQQRLQVLEKLVRGERIVVVSPIESLTKRLLPPKLFKDSIRDIKVGQVISLDKLKEYFVKYGYERVEKVEIPGQFSFRGGILDIYPVIYENPVRIELFDDEVDSIRFFEVDSQRSIKNTQKISLFPAREFFLLPEYKDVGLENITKEYEKQKQALLKKKDREAVDKITSRMNEVIEKITNDLYFPGLEQFQSYFYDNLDILINYFSQDSILCLDEKGRVIEAEAHQEKERNISFSDLLIRGTVLPGQTNFYTGVSDILTAIEERKTLYLSLLPPKGTTALSIETKTLPPFFSKIRLLADEIIEWKRKDYSIVILVSSKDKAFRLIQALNDCDIEATWVGENYRLQKKKVIIAQGNLSTGAEFIKAKTVFISENEIFTQSQKRTKRLFQKEGKRITKLDDLQVGDYVVHALHGIGRYIGVEKLIVSDVEKDYIVIKYSGEDKLFVPTDQVNLLQKYIGNEGKIPKVHKLGGNEWQKVKTKVQKSVKELAEGLIVLYAKRAKEPGYQFSEDDNFQREFEDVFPYKETPDQLRSIEEIKADMQRPMPMDRLLCGDVGYGKTEVAIRAAFKAVNEGKQAAILVPTTVLAQQHYNTFKERFSEFPVTIDVISRFKSPKEQKRIFEELKLGEIDIVIGTHRLLSKQVSFKDLGLLVVDEEQRFGVTHKEKIKGLKAQVDVLTLSATPIPRTLHMSLVGIRDLSVIETPPEDRYPIQTYVVEHSPDLVKDAIRRELGRGGQVYYVHNRVEDIEKIYEFLKFIIPEARIGIAHGKMKESMLEKVMFDFMEHELDILLCTTIIETGLDVSNVNTLIVDEADKMGLSQLYQLRGRVGRANRVAYAYLTYKKDKILSPTAEKRLHAIREFTELGSGFKIAMRDLEIRGAGNLLGPEQHGHVASVGFDMYCKLLEEAVKDLKGEKKQEEIKVEVDLEVSSFIPDFYINDPAIKLDFYQRIASIKVVQEVNELEDELMDRFGDMPTETRSLLEIARIKILAFNCKINSIKQKETMINLKFSDDPGLEGEDILNIVQKYKRRVVFGGEREWGMKINIVKLKREDWLTLLEKVLIEISSLVSGK